MKREEFLDELRKNLKGLPDKNIDDRISFYEECINDRISDGKTEEEAIDDLGTIDQIIQEIASETSLMCLIKEKTLPKRKLNAVEIILLILGFPLWLPLLITFLVLLFVANLLLWVGVLVVYAIELSFIASTIGGVIGFIACMLDGEFSLVYLGLSILSPGASILLFYGCKWVTIWTAKIAKKIFIGIKSWFIRRGE